jgi:hypothetical protein
MTTPIETIRDDVVEASMLRPDDQDILTDVLALESA